MGEKKFWLQQWEPAYGRDINWKIGSFFGGWIQMHTTKIFICKVFKKKHVSFSFHFIAMHSFVFYFIFYYTFRNLEVQHGNTGESSMCMNARRWTPYLYIFMYVSHFSSSVIWSIESTLSHNVGAATSMYINTMLSTTSDRKWRIVHCQRALSTGNNPHYSLHRSGVACIKTHS